MRNEMFSSYRFACDALKGAGVPDAETDARFLCEAAYGTSLSRALSVKGDFPRGAYESLLELIARRVRGEPLQYILGSWDFMGFSFVVGEGVLIPRSETEVLTEKAVERLKRLRFPTVYDLCAGSGCIGLSIKKLLPDARVFLIEKSPEALRILNENRFRLGLEHTTVAVRGDITGGYEAFRSLPAPDCILSNPPYVCSQEIDSLQKEVRFEPRMALDGGADGLDFYRVLSKKWFPYINDGGFISMEAGENQTRLISEMFDEKYRREFFSDYSGTERFITVERNTAYDL